MAFQVFKGTFTANTTTGNQTVSGITDQAAAAFTPKAILLWTTYQTAAGFTDELIFQIGMTDGTVEISVAGRSSDNDSPNDSDRSLTASAMVRVNSVGAAALRVGVFVSFGSGEFTINWTTADAVAAVFHFIAFGGANLSAHVGISDVSDVNDPDLSVSTLTFPPKAVITAQLPAIADSCNFPALGFIGIDDNDVITQNAASIDIEDAQTTSDTWRYQRTGFCSIIQTASDGTSYNEITYTPMGLSVAGNGVSRLIYLVLGGAIQGQTAAVLQPTTTGTQATTGVGFEPDLVLLMSVGQTPQTTVQTEAQFSFGAMTAAAQGVSWVGGLDAQNPSVTARRHATTKALTMSTPTATGSSSTTEAEAGFSALGADGFTVDWTTADATQRQYLYLAIGAGTGGGGGGGGGVMGARIFTGY